MELKNLLVASIAKLEEFVGLIAETKPFKAIDYTKNVTPFDVLRTEKMVESVDNLAELIELVKELKEVGKLDELVEIVKELKDERKELISKQDLTNELLAELVKNSKTTPTKAKKVDKKK